MVQGHAEAEQIIRAGLAGNLCRCATYPRLVQAIRSWKQFEGVPLDTTPLSPEERDQERDHAGGMQITIGGENVSDALSDFTLVTAEYHIGGLKGVIGVIGPTRIAYGRVIPIVDITAKILGSALASR